jgi:hypothetical protein
MGESPHGVSARGSGIRRPTVVLVAAVLAALTGTAIATHGSSDTDGHTTVDRTLVPATRTSPPRTGGRTTSSAPAPPRSPAGPPAAARWPTSAR